MDTASILLALTTFLTITTICVILFERLGFGSILAFILVGIVLGPYTPGPVPIHAVEELESVAELGVVLFLFTVGLELRPEKVWSMRRLIFGLGTSQLLVTAAALAAYLFFLIGTSWEAAIIVGLGLSMSSTAIVVATLQKRGEMNGEHGRAGFAILMAQDLSLIPVMALVPILAHQTTSAGGPGLAAKTAAITGVLAGIVLVGRYLLPAALNYCARQRQMEIFAAIVFLAIFAAAWAVDSTGVSMTFGAFLLGMLLAASDFRYQIEAIITPFKEILMGLFFIAVGMSIDITALFNDWADILVHVPALLLIKSSILVALSIAFGISKAAAIRTGLYLSQAGEFAFVLLGAALLAGLLSDTGHILAMLVVSVSMVATPLMVKLSVRITAPLSADPATGDSTPPPDLNEHVVIVGYNEVGQLVGLMLEKANITYLAIDNNIDLVRMAQNLGHHVFFGDITEPTAQNYARLNEAAAAFVTLENSTMAKRVAITLRQLYPALRIYVRVKTIADQSELVAQGIDGAGTNYIESTLVRGSVLLRDLGLPEPGVDKLVTELRNNNYEVIRNTFAQFPRD